MKTTIIFDLSEVLLRGLRGTEQIIQRKLNTAVTMQTLVIPEQAELFRGSITEDAYWAALIRANSWDTNVDMLKSAVRENFGEILGTRIVIRMLRKRRASTFGLLSVHAREWVAHLQKRFRYEKLFDYCSYSFHEGHLKPEPEAFYVILSALRTKAEETVFIDDMPKNVEAAAKLGMTGIYFRSARELLSDLYQMQLL